MLEQSESLDSDEVRNDDGDEVADPPDQWIDAGDSESLDEKLAAETSDEPSENWPFADTPHRTQRTTSFVPHRVRVGKCCGR